MHRTPVGPPNKMPGPSPMDLLFAVAAIWFFVLLIVLIL